MPILTPKLVAHRVTARREPAGTLGDGTPIEAVILENASGVSARILSFGATLQSLIAPDADGVLADVVLGHDDVAGYARARSFLGVTIGRYANRIAGGRFILDGVTYALSQNDGSHTLHGGCHGFDQAAWTILGVSQGASASVVLRTTSADGDSGFPGTVCATVTYTLNAFGSLAIAFEATTTMPTIINMTNHAVFNLAGHEAPNDVSSHKLTIAAAAYLPVDAGQIPTGELRPVERTVFDFRKGRVIGEGLRDRRDDQISIGRGYDHNFVLDKGASAEPLLAACLDEPSTGRRLEVFTTEPGLQLYTGNAFDGSIIGKHGRVYRMGDGVALEPQKFPDTPNQPGFGSARLDPGEVYRHAMIYRFSTIR